jgi:UDP-N-acetylmuramoylalanine--D-glutamate ligase
MQAQVVHKHVIVGLGLTGLSCARHLRRRQLPFSAMDTRAKPPGIDAFRVEFPEVELTLGGLDAERLAAADVLVLSPGVDPRLPEIRAALAKGVRSTGDIDLFAREIQRPIVAITGSNAKSTVTTLVGEMARAAGIRVEVAGNIGTPVLDLLAMDAAELYVLELSSFQLETTTTLGAAVATVLNLSEDHMDRYDSMQDYLAAKQRVFQGCRKAVVNRDDAASVPPVSMMDGIETFSFGLGSSDESNAFVVLSHKGRDWLGCGKQPLLAVDELRIAGQHNVSNALAALALGHALGLAWEPMFATLRSFKGLKHRCQWVANLKQVSWYNDSKGTNVGATVAAIAGLSRQGKVILLAGGVGKGADFSELAPAMAANGRSAILFGQDADRIAEVLQPVVPVARARSLQHAVQMAHELAVAGDVVLLSPACASFDMFRNYEHRGDAFVQAVQELPA